MAEQYCPPAPTEGCTKAQVEVLALYLKCTTECMEGVQKLPTPKFYNRQCEYLVEKLQKFVSIAGVVLHRRGPSVDGERHIQVLKLALVLAKRIESFVKSCSDDSFIQAAMALTNMSKCVASIGFDLELCRIALCKDDGCSARLTSNQVQTKYEDEVKEVEKKVSEDVQSLVTMVLHQLSEQSLKNENRLMAIYLLQRLNRMHPTAPSIPLRSPLYSVIDDEGILRAMYKLVRPGRAIGRGASATVYEATWLGTQVAKKTFVGRDNSDFMMEAEILARFNHPNITSMFCCEKDRWSSSIIMEIMDGDLHTLMLERCRHAGCDNPPFTIFEAVDMMLQIGEGVNYLHEKGICHRDLKSLNILVKSMSTSQSEVEVGYVHAKVADFGLSKTKNSTTFRDQTVNTGTPRWMAPEIIALDGRSQGNTSSEPRHPLKIDVHGFAMLCYEILTGYFPFHDEANPRRIKESIKRGIRPELPNNCPPGLKALIQECWDRIPRKRPSFAAICSKLKYVKYLLMTGWCSSEDTQASTSVESELFYGKPEPVLVINNRRRNMGGSMGVVTNPYYPSSGMTSGSYGGQGYWYNLVPDLTVKTPLMGMSDVSRITHALSMEGVYKVVCDIPQQTVAVSSYLSPGIVVGQIRQVMGTANIINYVDPLQPTFESPGQRARYSYDDSYSYDGRTDYVFTGPRARYSSYNGRSYVNEFRPSSYSSRYY